MAGAQAQSLASIKEVFDASAEEVPTLTAVGYAVVSSQPGKSLGFAETADGDPFCPHGGDA